MYLFDTNVVSEMRRMKTADPFVRRWTTSIPEGLTYLSVATLQEVEYGVLLKERRDPVQGLALRMWLDTSLLPSYVGRILPIDIDTARRAAALRVPDPRPYTDALLAAAALVHDMTVVTRNVRDFTGTGVRLLNPFEADPKVMTV